jgi:Mg2+/Co2+ transporter CorC
MGSEKTKAPHLRFPVISEGSEYLVMGNLMRRNVLTYRVSLRNEDYDVICIHLVPRYQRKEGELAHIRAQVKGIYQDADHG